MTESKKGSKTHKKFDVGMDPKNNHTSSHMLVFAPPWIRPWADLAKKTITLVRDNNYFIPTTFHQNPSSGSGEEVENVKDYGRRKDEADVPTMDSALWQ